MSEASAPKAPHLVEAKPLTFVDHVVNIFHLVIKELRSIRADPTMLILVVYAFSISVNTVATGAVTEATNLSVGIVDEDGSELSRQIAEGLRLPDLPAAGADHRVRHRPEDGPGRALCSSSKFRRISRPTSAPSARPASRSMSTRPRSPRPATARAHLKTAIANEIQTVHLRRHGSERRANQSRRARGFQSEPEDVVVLGDDPGHQPDHAADGHPHRRGADPRARAGHRRAPSRHAGRAVGNHAGEDVANGLVILVAAMLSLQFVVHWWIGSPIAGSLFVVPARGGHLCTRRRGARHTARHARDDHGPVRPARHAGADRNAIAVGQQHADGEHAGVAAIL